MTDPLPVGPAVAQSRTVLICDEEPAARHVLARLMVKRSGKVITAVSDGFAAVDAYTHQPAGVALIGIHRGTNSGFDALDLLLGLHPAAVVIAFGCARDADKLVAAVGRGARGLMLWVPAGKPGAAPRPTGCATAPFNGDRGGLTDREVQILRGMSRGRSNRAIGRELHLSEDTVKTHARRLFGKLGARDRAHAVAIGLRTGVLA